MVPLIKQFITKLSDSKNEVNDNIEIVGNRLKYAIINVNDNGSEAKWRE
ncbi:14438_t:CDS:2 [Entrophospora sp. SA101]|nr:14438_t:CDS:2 [Entrophospora sp. SA101]